MATKEEVTLELLHKDLEIVKKDLREIKKHMVDIDSVMTEDDYTALQEYNIEKSNGLFRALVGDYRILYEIDYGNSLPDIIKIDKRPRVYD